jgi:hypothetical protein
MGTISEFAYRHRETKKNLRWPKLGELCERIRRVEIRVERLDKETAV